MLRHRKFHYRILFLFLSVVGLGLSGCGKSNAEPQSPVVGWNSIMNARFYDSGLYAFSPVDVVFAPGGQVEAKVELFAAKGDPVAAFSYFPQNNADGAVFVKIKPENHSDYNFTPGDYEVRYSIAGAPATHFPFTVKAGHVSDDPFNPQNTLAFVGPWQQWAYLTYSGEKKAVEVSFWAGASDLAINEKRAAISMTLKRNGKIVAHSKVQGPGMLDHVAMRRHRLHLYHPHDRQSAPNAPNYTKAELEEGGKYVLTVERRDTGEVLRTFKFAAKKGELVPHPRTELSHKPRTEYIAPRVYKLGSTTYEFEEAFWISAP